MRKNLLTGLTVAFSIFVFFASTQAETITKPHTFTDGTPAQASEVNANFDTVYDQVNKVGTEVHIDSTNHRVGIGTTNPGSKLTIVGEGEKIGNAIVAYGGSTSNDVLPFFTGLRARGSASSPTAVQPGDIFAYFGGKGYDGSQWPEVSTAGIMLVAAEPYTGSSQGSRIVFLTTPWGTNAKQVSVAIDPDGTLKQLNGYTQLAETSSAPPDSDCTGSDSSQYRRMKATNTGTIYICTTSGWVSK